MFIWPRVVPTQGEIQDLFAGGVEPGETGSDMHLPAEGLHCCGLAPSAHQATPGLGS